MWPKELVREIAKHLFASTGSVRLLLLHMGCTCKEWHKLIHDDVLTDVLRMKAWGNPYQISPLQLIRLHFTPLHKRDRILHMSNHHIWSLLVDAQDKIQIAILKDEQFDDEIILWFGLTPTWTLLVYENTVGVMVYRTATQRFEKSILYHTDEWKQIPVTSCDGWLYKISGPTIARARLLTDSDVESGSRWEHVWTFGVSLRAMVVSADAIKVVTGDGRIGQVGEHDILSQFMPELDDVDQLFDCGGQFIVSLHGDGRVMTFDTTLRKVHRCVVEQGCYLLQVQGTFIAMAGRFFNAKQDLVIVLDVVSGWCWGVKVRGYISEMRWTLYGQLIALSGKTVFIVGGEKIQFLKS